ncbi:spermatogenesis associated 6-like protein isoform X4 [Scleropages formosus]|uniref:spermatogenesis associated 6-like protein isoform X4 n=1 Tax=Scleropages formosus TaxID=113540 RepID=UPI0010FA9176|nr:spermatogenesis associated 6-like protein isoform X4 [Scleropages formosus]
MCEKAVRVVAELHLRAVTCPGVFLPDKDDLYLSVCLMGQYKKSECVSPLFPLVFEEKMRFEKIFKHVSDPAEVAELLELGESLAHIEQDVRQFLFPEPKLVPPSPGVDREVLMMRASNFPGIAPRLEFSTRTTIRDCPLTAEKRVFPNVLLSSSSRRSCGRKTQVPRSKATSAARRRPSCGAVGCGKRQPQTPRCHSPGWHASARDGSRGARLLSKSASGLDFLNDDAEDATTRVGRSRLERWSPPGPERPLSPPALKISHRESMSRNGFRTGPPHIWDVVHERVQRLLNTSRAMRQLSNGSVESEVDDVMRRSITPQPRLP